MMWTRVLVLVLLAPPVFGETYRVVAEESRFEVHVGRAGLLKMFGHDHRILVTAFTGTVEWDVGAPESSRFVLDVDASSLEVADEGLKEDDRAKVQGDMEAKALALPEHPTISFASTRVRVKDASRIEVEGTLELRGMSHSLRVPVIITPSGDRLMVKGELELDSKRWGVPQISALGGSVKTKEKLQLAFEIVAVRE